MGAVLAAVGDGAMRLEVEFPAVSEVDGAPLPLVFTVFFYSPFNLAGTHDTDRDDAPRSARWAAGPGWQALGGACVAMRAAQSGGAICVGGQPAGLGHCSRGLQPPAPRQLR